MDGAYVTAEAFVKGIKVGRRQGWREGYVRMYVDEDCEQILEVVARKDIHERRVRSFWLKKVSRWLCKNGNRL